MVEEEEAAEDQAGEEEDHGVETRKVLVEEQVQIVNPLYLEVDVRENESESFSSFECLPIHK